MKSLRQHQNGRQWQARTKLLANRPSRRNLLRVHATSSQYEALKGKVVKRASDGASLALLDAWQPLPGQRVVVPFLTHFADLTSWEFAQKLREKVLPVLEEKGIPVITVGLGSPENAREFARVLDYPLENLYADEDGSCYKALGFEPGFAPDLSISPYLKLLPMLMGIGSEGTIQEVLRGYVGDKEAGQVFDQATPFDILGTGYQRPFELATLRLGNMIGILPKWGELSPPKEDLLTQQGGALVFQGTEVAFSHRDSGILKYADVHALLAAATSEAIGALPEHTSA